eukprot:gene13949-19884_t
MANRQSAPNTKEGKKGRLLNALTRMNERDTQKGAAEELLYLIKDSDQDTLPLYVATICATNAKQQGFACRECLRALGVVASDACPVQGLALAPPLLTKILATVKKGMQGLALVPPLLTKILATVKKGTQDADGGVRDAAADSLSMDADGGVRDAAADSLSLIAKGLHEVNGDTAPPAATNPVLKVVFELIGEPRKETQVAVGYALGTAAPFLGQLEPQQVKDILKRINNPNYQGAHALLGTPWTLRFLITDAVYRAAQGAHALLGAIARCDVDDDDRATGRSGIVP